MVTDVASRERSEGRGIGFWYQATRLARASACCRYRMGNVAELLRGATTVIDDSPRLSRFDGIEVLIVVRPFVDDACRNALTALRRRGVLLVGDYDDLLFAGDPAEYPLVQSGVISSAQWARRMQRYRAGLAAFDAFTVATAQLRAELSPLAPATPIAHVPNGLSAPWLDQGRALYSPWQPGDPQVIRYFSGSPSHDADFAQIAPVLAAFLHEHAQVSLEIVGPLVFDRELFPTARHMPRVPFTELPRLLASSWVALAPLAETRFNACKSSIKFLEAAAFGAPCIASINPDMAQHGDGGILFANTTLEWRQALVSLLDDEHRMERALRGKRHVDHCGLARSSANALLEVLKEWRH